MTAHYGVRKHGSLRSLHGGFFQDAGYAALLQKGAGSFVPDSCKDDLSVMLR